MTSGFWPVGDAVGVEPGLSSSHPSTNQAGPCLADEIRRDRVCSGWYGRRQPAHSLSLTCSSWPRVSLSDPLGPVSPYPLRFGLRRSLGQVYNAAIQGSLLSPLSHFRFLYFFFPSVLAFSIIYMNILQKIFLFVHLTLWIVLNFKFKNKILFKNYWS